MLKKVIAKSLLMILSLSAAWRVNGEGQSAWGYILSTRFGSFYTDGVLNPSTIPSASEYFAYYKMDDCSGAATVLDSSGNGRNTSHPYGNTVNYSAAGLAGTALWTVPGSGGFPLHADIASILSGDFSFAAWMKLDGPEAYSPIFYTPENSSYCFSMINYGGGYMLCDFGGGGASFPVDLFPTWHHVVFAKSGSTVTVFYDGVSLGSLPVGEHYSTSWKLFDSLWGGYNSALTDEMIFYSRALTAQQVTDLYESYDHPELVTVYFNTSYFQMGMGDPGACNLEYGTKVYAEGDQLGVFPTLTSNDPRYTLESWRYTMGDYIDANAYVYDNLQVCAFWTYNEPISSVYFDPQGGSSVMVSWPVYEGFTFEIPYLGNYWPDDPVYEGYVFGGWYSSTGGTGYPITGQTIFDSMTFGTGYMYAFAYWTLPPITFNFTSGVPPYGGGTAQTDIPGIENYATIEYFSADFASGTEITALPAASVPGPRYSFSGYWWEPYYATVYYAGIYAPLNNEPFGGPIPLYALWTDNGYQGQVTFDLQGGSGETPVINLFEGYVFSTGDFGQTVWPATPTYDGYTFVGWWTEVGGTGNLIEYDTTWTYASYPLSVTLYAYWIAN